MAKTIKLPADLRDWKVTSFVGEDNGCEVYKVSRKIDKNTAQNAILRHAFVGKSNYTDEHAEYFTEEADFIESVKELDGVSNYLDVYVQDNQNKKTCDLYIFTEELTSLEELMKTKTFAEDEVVDFGIQMSEMLETLEAKNIFHGNISPKNIFVTADGRYKIGGFTDFEGKIADTSFVAPEVYKQENVDYTTDIYSVGIIMYAMCNGGKIPFESDSCDRKNACEERFSGKAVTAPSEGDEKLKSVIVIACQPNNTNRWKNASNIKNALTSIKTEIGTSSPVPNPDVVVPENTDFDGNVFEEYDYDEFEDTEPTEPQDNFDDKDEVQTVEDAVLDNEFKGGEQLGIAEVLAGEGSLPVDGNAPVDSDEVSESDADENGGFEVVDVTDAVDESENPEVKTNEVSEEKQPEFEDISSVSSENDKKKQTVTDKKAEEFEDVSSNSEVAPEVLPPVTSVEVFDDYSGADHKNVLTSNESSKDYGDFFEDEPSVKRTDNKADDTKKIEEKNDFDDNSFEDNHNEFGYTDEEDAPNTWDMWLKGAHPDDVKFVEDSYMAALRDRTGNTNYDVTYRAVKKDGTLHWYRAVGYTIRREDGSAEFCYGYIMDINEQKEASDMLEEALEQARIANTAKTSFLARISHDIRTPMNGIIGLIDINDKHADDIAFMAKNRKKAKVAANHLLSLINDVLQLSKLEVYITGSCNTG